MSMRCCCLLPILLLLNPSALLLLLLLAGAPPPPAPASQYAPCVPTLARRSSTGGYTLLLECSQLLMVLGSSALYCSTARGQLGQHPYLDAAMQQKDLANTGEREGVWSDAHAAAIES